MRTNILFSAIIPTHNRVHEVVRAVQSVLEQSWKDFEVIVVDDGSSDETCEVLEKMSDERIRVIKLPVRGGAARARNVGIGQARGDFVAFLDSDDLWEPSKLETVAKIVEGRNGSDDIMIYHPSYIHDRGPRRINPRRGLRENEDLGEYILYHGCSIQTSTITIGSKVAKEVLFNEALPKHQDWDLVLRLKARGIPCIFCDKVLVVYSGISEKRISHSTNVEASRLWSRNSGLLSERALAAFNCVEVAPQLKRSGKVVEACGTFLRVAAGGKLKYAFVLKCAFKTFAPLLYGFTFRMTAKCFQLNRWRD